MLQPDPTPPLHSSEFAAPDGPPDVPSDTIPIDLRWQQLASMDRQSAGFLPLFSSLTAEGNRFLTTKLCGDDARVTLGFIDEVGSAFVVKAMTYVTPSAQILKDGRIPEENELNTLLTMRMLAYNSGQVPPRYQVDRQSLSVEGDVIFNGEFVDVQEGRLGDKMVAVRTLRTDRRPDRYEVQKVCVASK